MKKAGFFEMIALHSCENQGIYNKAKVIIEVKQDNSSEIKSHFAWHVFEDFMPFWKCTKYGTSCGLDSPVSKKFFWKPKMHVSFARPFYVHLGCPLLRGPVN